MFRRRGVVSGHATQPPGSGWGSGQSGTTALELPAVLRATSGATGVVRFCGGFPLPEDGPGALRDGQMDFFALFVNGVEVPLHVEPLLGHHANGAIRSIRYDFEATVSEAYAVIPAVVRIGMARTTASRPRQAITRQDALNQHWLRCTDTAFLTRARPTGMPLAPTSSWTAPETAWLKTMTDTVLAGLAPNGSTGTAYYDGGRHVMSLYCCTGDVTYLQRALLHVDTILPNFLPARSASSATNGATISGTTLTVATHASPWPFRSSMVVRGAGIPANTKIVAVLSGNGSTNGGTYQLNQMLTLGPLTVTGTSYSENIAEAMDPENLGIGVSVEDGMTSEWYSIAEGSFEGAYLFTGWLYYWLVVNNRAQAATRAGTPGNWLFGPGDSANIRFNWRHARWVSVAARLDATWRYRNADSNLRQESFVTDMPAILTSLNNNRFDASRGSYRENLRGLNPGQNAQGVAGWFPTFQVSTNDAALLDYYHECHADSRIPEWVQTNVDAVLATAGTLPANHYYENNGTGTGKWAVPYRMEDTITLPLLTDGGPSGSGGRNDPFDICMHSRAIAFLAGKDPGRVVNGKTYPEWLAIVTHPKQMGGMAWNWKYLAESIAAMSMPYYRLYGDPGGPVAMREPTVHASRPPS